MKSAPSKLHKNYAKIPVPTSVESDRRWKYFDDLDQYRSYLQSLFVKKSLILFGRQVIVKGIQHPGAKGGHFHYTRTGNISYDQPATPTPGKATIKRPQLDMEGGETNQINVPLTEQEKAEREKKQLKERELEFVMKQIKAGKLPKGAEKLIGKPKPTPPKIREKQEAAGQSDIFGHSKKVEQASLF